MHSTAPHDTVLARVPAAPGQELHLRRRHVDAPAIPDMYDWVLYDVEADAYSLSTPFPISPEVLGGMIAALQQQLTELA